MMGRAGCVACWLDPANLDAHCTETPAPIVEVDYQHGVCFCECCGAVIRVIARLQREPRVVDVDGRSHRCERYIAGTMARHGVEGMAEIVRAHARRPVIAEPYPGTTGEPASEPEPIWKRKRP